MDHTIDNLKYIEGRDKALSVINPQNIPRNLMKFTNDLYKDELLQLGETLEKLKEHVQ